jgi:hypothetical protein
VELLLKELLHFHVGEVMQFLISTGILAGTVLVARSGLRHVPIWGALSQLFKVLYAPFALLGWLVARLALPFRRAANA